MKRRELEDQLVATGLLRHRIRQLEEERQQVEGYVKHLKSQLTVQGLRAVDAMDVGYRMGAGIGHRDGSIRLPEEEMSDGHTYPGTSSMPTLSQGATDGHT